MKLSNEAKILLSKLIWIGIYIVLLISLCVSGVILFEKTSYILTYVDGPSMYPTLNNYTNSSYHDCGLVDESLAMKKYMERFDIVITYYASDYTNDKLNSYADKKVKRLVGLPNEKVHIYVEEQIDPETSKSVLIRHLEIAQKIGVDDEGNNLYGEYAKMELPFDVYDSRYYGSDVAHSNCEYELGDDEYFVLGDNWKQSRDSSDSTIGHVDSHMITGILIKTIGYCTINPQTKEIDKIYETTQRYFK